MTANECEFEHEGFCNPPKEYKDFICPSSVMKDGMRYCEGENVELMTEEEYEAQQMEEKVGVKEMTKR